MNPYGDGLACERILQALEHLAGRADSPVPFMVGLQAQEKEM